MESLTGLIKSRRIRLVFLIILALITYYIKYIPHLRFRLVGIETKGSLSPMTMLLPVNGVLLGPFYGTIATLLGIGTHLILEPETAIFGPYSILLPAAATFMAGLLSQMRWREAAVFFGSLIVVWYLLPTGREVWMLPYLHLITLVAIILLGNHLWRLIGPFRWKLAIGLFVVASASVLTDHLIGNVAAVLYWDIPASAFYEVLLLYSVERLSIALAATIISTVFIYLVLTVYAPLPLISPTEKISFLPFSIPTGSVILGVGAPHSGKSELLLCFSYERLRLGETVLYMNCEAAQDNVRRRMGQLGIDIRPYEVRRLFQFLDAHSWHMKDLKPTTKLYGDFETTPLGQQISATVQSIKPSLLIVDSISPMLIYEKPEDVLGFLRSMVLFLKRIEITTIMTVEEGIHDENFIRGLHHLADGILEMRLAKELGKHAYYLRARKFLGLFSPTDWIKFEVTPKGALLTKPHWHIKVDINKLEVSSALGKLEEGEFFKSLLKQLEEKSE